MNLVTRLANDLRLMLRRPERLQFAALCYRWTNKDKVAVLELLIITSRDTGRWVIPKGWPMENRLAHEVAEREAFEEAGVEGKASESPFGSYEYLKALDNGIKVPCKVQVHTLEVERLVPDFKEKGLRTIEWVSCAEAAKRVDETSLKQLIGSFGASMRSAQSRKSAQG